MNYELLICIFNLIANMRNYNLTKFNPKCKYVIKTIEILCFFISVFVNAILQKNADNQEYISDGLSAPLRLKFK